VLLQRYGLDALIVATAVASALSTFARDDAERPDGWLLWFEAIAVAGAVLTLLARRRFPFAAPAALWLLCTALSFVDGGLVVGAAGVFVAGLGAALLLGNLHNAVEARVGLVIVVAGAAVVVYHHPGHGTGEFLFVPVQFAIAWLVGFALRERAEETEAARARAAQAERERETATRLAVAEERARIARELHDVVAHAVSVMVLQVGAVRHGLPDSEAEGRDALRNVEQAGRTALAEMRRLLGAMRNADEEPELVPHPGLHDLEALADDVRAAGLAVHLQVYGDPAPLSPGLDLSAYRIVQEGLTNALKHARASRADVAVRYDAQELAVEVRDDGDGRAAAADGLGHGLVGVRERVKLYGGDMSAGPTDTGFVLKARLPLDGYVA